MGVICKYMSFYQHTDGFGSQYQHIIATLLYCFNFGYQFVYNPIEYIEHNYDNDTEYIYKLETLMNLKSHYINIRDPCLDGKHIEYLMNAKAILDRNIYNYDMDKCLAPIREMFWANKDKTSVFCSGKIHVAIHIRRMNEYDKTLQRAHEEIFRFNSRDSYYLHIMERIRQEHGHRGELQFHVYSQGDPEDFECYIAPDTILHINENICDTFTQMVGADIIMTSFSSLSYVAALLSEGTVYFHPFWHQPRGHWIRI